MSITRGITQVSIELPVQQSIRIVGGHWHSRIRRDQCLVDAKESHRAGVVPSADCRRGARVIVVGGPTGSYEGYSVSIRVPHLTIVGPRSAQGTSRIVLVANIDAPVGNPPPPLAVPIWTWQMPTGSA